MKKYIKHLSILFIIICSFNNCEKSESNLELINDEMILEYRNNYWMEFENDKWNTNNKLEIITNVSDKFTKIKTYFNNCNDLKQTEELSIYPNYIISSKDLKILIAINKIGLEFKNENGEILKMIKNLTPEEFREFRYLTENNNWVTDYGKIYGRGKTETASYTFCGIVPKDEEYEYKVGKWQFWSLNGKLIAEGEFDIDIIEVNGLGGCSFNLKKSKINSDWKTYDSNGNIKELTIEQKYIIENAKL